MTLQQQGEDIATKFRFANILNQYGEAHLVGNLALGTTVKPDIDYLIYCDKDEWNNITCGLKTDFAKLTITGYEERELKESGKYLITFKYKGEGTEWSIDITLTAKGGDYLTDSYQFFLDYHERFTPTIIKTVVRLKKYFYNKKMLRNSMSYYIYRAVIDENAKTITDIYDYLKRNKVYIPSRHPELTKDPGLDSRSPSLSTPTVGDLRGNDKERSI